MTGLTSKIGLDMKNAAKVTHEHKGGGIFHLSETVIRSAGDTP